MASVIAGAKAMSGMRLNRSRPASLGAIVRTRSTGGRVAVISAGSLVLITVFAVLAPLLAPHDPVMPVGVPFQAPFTGGSVLGTDQLGRDIFSRALEGLSVSWLTSLFTVLSVALVGTVVGLTAGYAGGWIDRVLMAIVDFFLAMPSAILAIVIAASLGPSLKNVVLAIAILSWPYYARLVRAEVRSLVRRPHMEAARLAGNGHARLMLRHLLPGAWPVLLVTISLDLGGVIVMFAGLSFLGLGRAAPAPELGAMVSQGLPYLLTNWWIAVVPALFVMFVALVANLAGDGLRSTLKEQ